MTALQQGTDQSPQGLTSTDHPVTSAHTAPPQPAHVAEVNALRLRVAELEAELAAIRTPRAPPRPPVPAFAAPEGAETATPPHRSSASAERAETAEEAPAPPAAPVPNPGFAQAWEAETGDEKVTFEEKFAERAFFDGTTVDERSRNWLLDS